MWSSAATWRAKSLPGKVQREGRSEESEKLRSGALFRIGSYPEGLSTCPQQYRGPVKIKKCPLTLREFTDIDDGLRVDAHAFERGTMSHRRQGSTFAIRMPVAAQGWLDP